jgi:hypothetical protein
VGSRAPVGAHYTIALVRYSNHPSGLVQLGTMKMERSHQVALNPVSYTAPHIQSIGVAILYIYTIIPLAF